MPKKKATPEETRAEIELQLSERRFILEAMNTAATVIQVPVITAFIWYYLSRTNATLGALNKAILAAELTPLIGDIQFPSGVLLGAAMESTEDFLKILEDGGVIPSAEEIKEAAKGAVVDTGDVLADVLVGVTGLGKGFTCEEQASAVFDAREAALDKTKNPLELLLAGDWRGAISETGNTISYGALLKSLKTNGCDRPGYVTEDEWQRL